MKSKVVLLVEDNPRDEALTLRALKKCNLDISIIVAHDGVEALDFLFGTGEYLNRDTNEMPQLILLDLKLPKIDGLMVLNKIRLDERTKKLPVVIFTSSTEESDLTKSYELGVNSYICKPVEFEKFAEATRQVGIYWLTLNLEAPK